MTTEQIQQMLETARKATQEFEVSENGSSSIISAEGLCYNLAIEDAHYFASCCPSRIIPLLKELLNHRAKYRPDAEYKEIEDAP